MNLEQIEKICDNQGFWVNKYDDMFGAGKPGWEVGQGTPCGEDWFENFETDDVDTFIANLENRIDGWDSEEEAKVWFESAGKNGVPGIRDLLDDADWKLEQLKDLLAAIKEAPDEENETEIVDDKEEIKTENFVNNELDNSAIDDLVDYALDLDEGSSTTECYGNSDICFSISRRIDDYKCYDIKAWYDDADGNEIELDDTIVQRRDLKNFFINTINKAFEQGYVVTENKQIKTEAPDYMKAAKQINDISTEEIVEYLVKDKACDTRLKDIWEKYLALRKLDVALDDDKYIELDNKAEKIIAELANVDLLDLDENKQIKTEAPEDENDDAEIEQIENEENSAVEDLIQEYKDKSPLYERVIGEIVDDSESYNGATLLEKINGRLRDLSNGLVTGVVSSLIYYTDTVKFFEDYYDDIWDVVETLVDDGLDPIDALKQNCSESEIIMGSDSVKNWVVWMVYEEIAFQFENALSEL